MPEQTKEKRIAKELNRISKFFEEVDANQKAIAKPLLQNAAFMKVTLEDLQDIINAEGVTDQYQNGANQYGVKQSATLQSYNSLIKNYASVIKTLAQLLPPEKKQSIAEKWLEMHKPPTAEEREAEQRELEAANEELRQEIRRFHAQLEEEGRR